MELDPKVELIKDLVPIGLMHIQMLLEEEVEELAEVWYARKSEAAAGRRFGSNPGTVRLAGQRVPIEVPRIRGTQGEVPLRSYRALKGRGDVDENLLRRVLYWISCRNYEAAAEAIPGAIGLSSSSVSRSFVEASSAKLKEFQDRDLSKDDILAIFLDGKSFADEMMVIAMGITAEGKKKILGFVQTDTENEKVLTPFLRSLMERGLDVSNGLLVIQDGGKGLLSAVKKAFRGRVVVQRCLWHKRENVVSYLPRDEQAIWRKRLQRAYDRPTHKAMSYGRMKKDMPRLAAEVKRWFKEAEITDRSEDRQYGPELRGDELPSWVANKQQRVAKMQEAMEALEAEAKAEAEGKKARDGKGGPKPGRPSESPPGVPRDKAQRNFTDPDSRIMKTKDGFEQAYNAQAAVDAASQVIVAQLVTRSGNDKQQLAPMVAQIKENTGRQAEELSADSGYCSEENLKELNRRHISGYIATGRQKHGESSATGERRSTPGTRTHAMKVKLKRAGYRSRYRLRKQTVEPVFGQIKEGRGFRRFLLRGIEKVHGEWSLICAAHNFLKWARAVA